MGMGRGEARAHRGQLTSFHSSRVRVVLNSISSFVRVVLNSSSSATLLVYSMPPINGLCKPV
jgi:hypothetical protein